MSLRRYFQLVGWLMIAVGFLFWGYHWPMARYFGVETPDAFVDVRELDKALSFGGLFGGALMLYGEVARQVRCGNAVTLARQVLKEGVPERRLHEASVQGRSGPRPLGKACDHRRVLGAEHELHLAELIRLEPAGRFEPCPE